MARYEDYVKKQDALENEIDDAAEAAQNRVADNSGDVPERFRGKTAAEIAASYAELEKAFSRQGNDLGELRKTVDEFITLQSQPVSQPEADPISVDDLYADPEGTIRKVASTATNDRIAALERELAQTRTNARLAELDSRYEGWRDVSQSPEFANWIAEQPYRARMAAEVQGRGDLDAAETLLGMFYETNRPVSRQGEQRRQQELRNATLESSSPEAPHTGEPHYSRARIVQAKAFAKRGDPAAEAWLKQHGAAINQAYLDGRVTD